VEREEEEGRNASGSRKLFIMHNGPSAIVLTNKGQLGSGKGNPRGFPTGT
jgi:hypothetical protein